MLASRLISCPSCDAKLAVPDKCLGRTVICSKCRKALQVPRRLDVCEAAVADWLVTDETARSAEGAERSADANGNDNGNGNGHRLGGEHSGGKTATIPPQAKPQPPAAIQHAVAGILRVVRNDRAGVLMEFPPSRLLEPEFRCAMPRRCLQCGGRAHLHAHVLIYANRLVDSISLEDEHQAGPLVVSDDELRNLAGPDLLVRLPKVPNVPHPADLPMPYWICDMCSGSGVVSGQIEVNSQTGGGFCRLLIRSMRRAQEFYANCGITESGDYKELCERIAATAETPWDSLPEVIQHRLQQWFRPRESEQFLAYLPDRDHVRTEDGMAGIVVSSQRLAYHTQLRHREARSDEPMELELSQNTAKANLAIKAPNWEIKHMTVEREGVNHFRRAMAMGHFHASWG